MKVIKGEHIGFCHGVQRAYDMVEDALERYGNIYTYGDIIHNKEVVNSLQQRGAIPVQSLDGLAPGSRIIIRSHGVPPQFYEECRSRGIEYIDATCPFVSRIHRAVTEKYGQGYEIVIAGKSDHPEVIGINGYCGNTACIVDNAEQAGQLPHMGKVFLVAQTTIISAVFEGIAEEVRKRADELEILHSICSATELRQNEARQLATKCDIMLVIGGKHSSNTVKLLQICKKSCEKAYIVESTDDVDIEKLSHDDIIGVVAGASTPQWSIREVIASMFEKDQNLTGTEEQNLTEPVTESEQNIEPSATELTAEEPVAEEAVEAQPEQAAAAEEPQPEQAEEKPEEPSAEQPTADDAAEQTSEGEEAVKAEEEATAEEPERELTPEESFERDLEKTMVRIRPRQVKKGTVVQIAGDDVFVNIGYKADGIIPQAELSTDPKAVASEILQVGDEVTVEILKVNDGEGNVLLSKRIVDKRNEDREAIAELEDGQHFEVRIRQAVKGGLLGEYKGARVFIPASHASDKYVENLDEFAGQTIKVKALEVDKNKRRIVASRKQVLQEEAIEARKKKLEAYEPGQRLKGIVRRITDFGAFTDIGGIDGLIHVTDLSWGRVKHPSDVVSVGDELEVEVLSVTPETERISLGLKQLMPKPWDNIEERYLIGDIVEGKVDRIAPFGAFVELEPGLFGLVHISQVATRRIDKVEDELRVGDVIAVKVLDINTENRRISLSRRAVLQEDRPQHIERDNKKHDDEHIKYEIPPVESASVTLGDFFPKEELLLADDIEDETEDND